VAAASAGVEGLLGDGENGGRTSPVCAAGGVQGEGESEEGEGKQTISKAGVSTMRLSPAIYLASIRFGPKPMEKPKTFKQLRIKRGRGEISAWKAATQLGVSQTPTSRGEKPANGVTEPQESGTLL